MDITDVVGHAARIGDVFYLATVSSAGMPHVVPLAGGWNDGCLYTSISPSGRTGRNLAHEARCHVHYQVGDGSNWDSLLVWGEATILDSVEDKRRLWSGVLPYDPSDWASGGPEDSPDTVFVEIEPARALLLHRYGLDGREEWRVG
jgi:nitroimidazol reductase NimA-like FMN-containing flavoprotein (pyridoxamine 5'-phosphate oxidase superfamily)